MRHRDRKFVNGEWLFQDKEGNWKPGRKAGKFASKNVGPSRSHIPWADPSGPGELWALRISKAIEKNPGAVKNRALREQALAYAAVGGSFEATAPFEYSFETGKKLRTRAIPSEREVARSLRQGRYELSGWAKRVIKMSLGPEEAQFLRSPEKFDITPSFLERWDKAARANKIVRSAKFHKLSMETILFRAERAGVLSEVQEMLGTKSREATALKKSIRGGKPFFETAIKFARAKPWAAAGIGIGVGIAAALAIKPLSWFSGRDDDYNTIEGLPHGGLAGQMRSQFTDFGSGYRSSDDGYTTLDKIGGALIFANAITALPNMASNLKMARGYQKGYMTFYHGTPNANATKLLSQGLIPGNEAQRLAEEAELQEILRRANQERAKQFKLWFAAQEERLGGFSGEAKTQYAQHIKKQISSFRKSWQEEKELIIKGFRHNKNMHKPFIPDVAQKAAMQDKVGRIFFSAHPWISKSHAAMQANKGLGPLAANMRKMGGFLGYFHSSVWKAHGSGKIFEFALPMSEVTAQVSLAPQSEALLTSLKIPKGIASRYAKFTSLFAQTSFAAAIPTLDLSKTGSVTPEKFSRVIPVEEGKILWNKAEKLGASTIKATPNYWKAAGRLGMALVPLATMAFGLSVFSGKDDSFNTIEGLSDQGIASNLRQDFGSGWLGLWAREDRKRGGYHRRRGHTRRGYWYKGRWVEKKWIKSHFVKQNENAFGALADRGVAGETRKENTDFGSGFRYLDFGGLISEQTADQKVTENEWRKMLRTVRIAQDQEILLQILDRDEARRSFNKQLRWRDQAKSSRIKRYLTERESLGAFGSFTPGANVLQVGGLVDPRDVVAQGFLPVAAVGSDSRERAIGEILYNWLDPKRVEETILHEGLHSIWSNDMDPVHKARFISEAEEQLGGWFKSRGPDVEALAGKAPIYAQVVRAAEDTNKPKYVEWVANEMFAHRGAALAYSNLGYTLGENPALDRIVGEYVQPGPRRTVGARFENFDPSVALQEYFGRTEYSRALGEQKGTLLPKGTGVQFSRGGGLPTALMGVPIDPEILEFRRRMDQPGERSRIRRLIEERSAEYQKTLGSLDSSDFLRGDIGTIEAINRRRSDLKAVNLDRFQMEVEDADTIVLKRRGIIPSIKSFFGYGDTYVRLAGIDAPEVEAHKGDPLAPFRIWQDQPAGTKATWALKRMLAEQDEVKLVISQDQKTYGRYLGVLANEEGTNINMELLRGGAVSALPFGPRKTDILLREQARAAEETARVHRRGMWSYARYQATHIAERYIGRNITHNTLTRLDKLSGNLTLGAYGSFLNSFGAQQRELTFEEIAQARRIGKALRKTHGPPPMAGAQTFSGKDDAHLQIEGLSHQGIAWQLRQAMTDFGSGFKGALISQIPKALGGVSAWKGRHTVAAGAAALGMIGGVGALTGGWSSENAEGDQEASWGKRIATGAGLMVGGVGLAIGVPAAAVARSAYKAVASTLGKEKARQVAKNAFVTQLKVGGRSILEFPKTAFRIHTDKEIVAQMRQAGAERGLTGIHSTALGRGLAVPAKYIGEKAEGAIEHTASWLGKNWIPKLKEGDPAAIALAGMSVFDAYHAAHSAYEGDIGGVAGSLAKFAGAKYAYMGWHHRKPIGEWIKKQKLADYAVYATAGMQALGTMRNAALEAAQYHLAYTRTGVSVGQYYSIGAEKYGETFLRMANQAKDDYARALGQLDDKTIQAIMADSRIKGLTQEFGKISSEAKKTAEAANRLTKEQFVENLRKAQGRAAEVGPDIEQKTWLGSKAAERFVNQDIEQAWGVFEQTRKAAQRASEAAGVISPETDAVFSRIKNLGKDFNFEDLSEVIPKRGSAVNAFDGMRHGGLAGELRKQNTDFGSVVDLAKAANRAQELYFRGFKEIFKKSGLDVSAMEFSSSVSLRGGGTMLQVFARDPGGKTLMQADRLLSEESVELFSVFLAKDLRGKGIGRHFYDIEPRLLRQAGYEAGTVVTSPAVINPVTARWQMKQYGAQIAASEGYSAERSAELTRQILEKKITHETMPMAGLALEGKLPAAPKFSSTQPKWSQLTDVPQQVRATDVDVESAIANLSKTQAGWRQMDESRKLLSNPVRIKGLRKNFAVDRVPEAVPTRGSASNSFDGMGHTGLASHSRKKNTDFGSRWNALKGLVRAGETFEKMVAGSEFKAALSAAKQIKHIKKGPGGGFYSDIFIMEGTFRDQQFKFVRKVGHLGEHEAKAQMAGAHEMLPDVYSFKTTAGKAIETDRVRLQQGVMEMEYFEGKTLSELQAAKAISGSEVNKIRGQAQELYQKTVPGWQNPDIHPGNIMMVPTGQKGTYNLGLIDLGLATPTASTGARVAEAAARIKTVELPLHPTKGPQKQESLLESMVPKSEKQRRLLEKVARQKAQQALAQKATQRATSEAALRGGKGHKAFKSKG